MKLDGVFTTLNFYPNRNPKLRMFALWYSCILISIWTILGHTVLGFEQSYAHPIVGVATACAMQFLLEWIDARANRRPPRFAGGLLAVMNMLPPAIIPGLACAMLIYPNSPLSPVVFASALSIASKVLFSSSLVRDRL
jgi:hypothetical protein